MTGDLVLDANAAIAARRADAILSAVMASAGNVALCVPVVGELFFGAEKSARPAQNLAAVRSFTARFDVLGTTSITAEHYGRIRKQLRAKGRPIPENDIWIAAIAVEHGLTVLTQDAHFSEVDGLNVLSW